MVALQEKSWIEDHGEVVPNYETEPNAPHFNIDEQTDTRTHTSDTYEGFVPSGQELNPVQQRFYAIMTRAIAVHENGSEQQVLEVSSPETVSKGRELPSDDNRDMWRQPIPQPQGVEINLQTPRRSTIKEQREHAARFRRQAYRDRWGR